MIGFVKIFEKKFHELFNPRLQIPEITDFQNQIQAILNSFLDFINTDYND